MQRTILAAVQATDEQLIAPRSWSTSNGFGAIQSQNVGGSLKSRNKSLKPQFSGVQGR